LCLNFVLNAQVTRIRGKVIDKETNEPLPFVNISLAGTSIGTITDFNGDFFLETRAQPEQIVASYMGYITQAIAVSTGNYQELEIQMQAENIELEEIVVNPGENPAHPILRNIIANKKINDPTRISHYQYEIYNKMELDINNITEEYKKQRMFRQFQFIFDYIDTSAITGKTFLPVFIVESLSDYYYQKNPRKKKEVIKANNISGIDGDKVSEFTGQMYLDFNIYDNFVPIMGLDMVSPVANFGLMYYKYYLIDSAFRDNHWCYQISFQAKRKQEPTFNGYLWVQDTTFAIQNYKIRLADDVNINFVDDFVAEQTYTLVEDSVWFPQKQELFIDFAVTNNEYGFFGRKTTSFQNIKLYPNLGEKFFSKQLEEETVIQENSRDYSLEQWQDFRPEQLSVREQDIYHMVDSIKEVPLFNSIIDVINTIVTGYWVKGPIEIGPYYTLYSFNPIEGHRFKFGFRTSNAFSTKIMLNGHLAYGTRDQKIKYGTGFVYDFQKNPRRRIGVQYKLDYEQLGITENAFLSDNFLASIFSRELNDKLTEVNDIYTYYEHEWFQGYSNTLTVRNKRVYSSETVPFKHFTETGDTLSFNSLVTSEIKLNARFAFNEKFVMGEFDRVSLGTRYPIININFTAGIQGIFKSDYEYYKLNVNLEHTFPISPFGDFRYVIDAGKIFGNAPYPFLQLHEGNQTYAYDDYAFNLMNYYEFVSKEYASLMVEHHFNGLFFNHVPLMRRMKLREVVGFKMLAGSLSERTPGSIMFPENLDVLTKPYMEAGAGIENLFKFVRIDAIWRLTYRDPNQNTDEAKVMNFGIFAKLQIMF
jgi:ferritin